MGGGPGGTVYQMQHKEDEDKRKCPCLHLSEGHKDLQGCKEGNRAVYQWSGAQEEVDGPLKLVNLRGVLSRDGVQRCGRGGREPQRWHKPRTSSSGSQSAGTRVGSCCQTVRQRAVWRGAWPRVSPGQQYLDFPHLPARREGSHTGWLCVSLPDPRAE